MVAGNVFLSYSGLVFDVYMAIKIHLLEPIIKTHVAKKASLETFATRLLDKIIHAHGAGAIERYVAVAVRALNHNKINGYIIQRFIDRVTWLLDHHQPVGEQQQANAGIARTRLQEFRQATTIPSK